MLTQVKKKYRRLGAFLLALAMIATNVMTTGLSTTYAAERASDVRYVIDAQELQDAVAAAKEAGDVFDFEGLMAEEGQKSLEKYRGLLGADSGEIYELNVSARELLYADGAEMRVLYDAAADRVILLFVNAGEEAMAFRAQIGDEYVTQVVKVKSAVPGEAAADGESFGNGGAGLGAAGGSIVPETDADGNIIGEVSADDANEEEQEGETTASEEIGGGGFLC